MAALLPTLEGRVDEDVLRDFKQLLANVRMAFTGAVSATDPPTDASS